VITWTGEDEFELEGTRYVLDQFGVRIGSEPDRFCLAKVRTLVERYVELLRDLAPEVIVEVGILEGASTALFADLARPRRLVAIDRARPTAKLQAFIARRGLEGVVSLHGGVDQADADRLRSILDAELGQHAVDLVVDDASHLLDPTRATFNCLFPRLRPGGIYLLEDWALGLRAGSPAQLPAGERPLVELVFEIVAAKGRAPGAIGDVTVRGGWTLVERGAGSLDDGFDVRRLGSSG
jgi:predicted O-methyltransferase YrrM